MRDFDYEHEQITRSTDPLAKWLSIGLFLIAAALVAVSILVSAFRMFYQLGAIVLLTVSVFIFVKYVARTYQYRTERRENGDYDFIITDIRRTQRIVAVRLSFARQINGYTDDPEEIARIRKDRSIRCYTYCPDLKPEEASLLFANDGEDRIAVIFQPDTEMREVVRSLVVGMHLQH